MVRRAAARVAPPSRARGIGTSGTVVSDIARDGLQNGGKTASIRSTRVTSTTRCGSFRPRHRARRSAGRSSGAHPAVLLALGLAALGCPAGAPPAPQRILLVTIDTLRADHLGSYGAPNAHTPHLDELARSGVRFDAALSPVPLTLPAHTSLMTAVDPPRHGVRHNSVHRLGEDLPTLAERLRGAGYATAAFVGALVLERRFGLARGFDVYDDRTEGRVSGSTGYAERTADRVVDAALEWLERAPPRFFLWLHFYDPHADYRPPPGFASAFPGDLYSGEIAFVDAELGRLLDGLRARFGADELLVAVTSDHGEALGDHGEPTHAYTLYESTQHVPLLLAGAGLPRGVVSEQVVSLVDVAPTLLALAGAEPLPDVDGRDLRRQLDAAEPGERALYMETLATALDLGWSPLFAVRVGPWKYIRAPRSELYDLREDPGELDDRAARDAARAAALDALLERHLAGAARAPLPVALSEQDRARLRSLGYVVPDRADVSAVLETSGRPDPKDRLWVLGELSAAQAELGEGHAGEALERLRALGDDPPPSIRAQRAAAALAAGELAAAESDARAVLDGAPARSDMRILLARILAAQGRESEAGRALAALPSDVAPAAWVALAAARGDLAAGQPERARRRLELARARHPGDAELASFHAALLEQDGRLEEALAAREAALALSPEDPSLRNDVAWTLARLGRDLERAAQLVREALANAGEDPRLLDTLATVQLARGDAAAALTTVDKALEEARGPTRVHLLALRAEASGRVIQGPKQAPQGSASP
jgi:choline-sulfatase